MDSNDQKAVETLCKAIVQTVKQQNNEMDIIATVCEEPKNKKYCRFNINKQVIEIQNGIGASFHIGDRALIHCVNGDENKKVVIAKLSGDIESGVTPQITIATRQDILSIF